MLKDQAILIVGGGSGIGFAVAQAAREAGARVTIASTNVERLTDAAARLGGDVQVAQLDLTDEAALATYFGSGVGFDHIVSTAGDWGGPRGSALSDLDLTAAQDLFRVRFWGSLALAKHGLAALSPEGSLTFTDGMIAHRPSKGAAVSSAMAGAIEHLVRGLAVELAPVRVNGVCPGLIRTGVWDRIPEDRREEQLAEMTKRQLLPRIGEPHEAAEAYLYLMRGSYTTGQVLFVEGGTALGR